MTRCLFASDLHGRIAAYRALFGAVADEPPELLLLGGDLLPSGTLLFTAARGDPDAFVGDFLLPELAILRDRLGRRFPRLLLVLGNDDPASVLPALAEGERRGLFEHIHMRRTQAGKTPVYGYACVPPTPFLLKDWERYDVSRHVDPGCVSPEEGVRTVPTEAHVVRWSTIARDLATLAGDDDLERAVFLFHAPPYRTPLDRAALDGRTVDGVAVDVHVGSVAIRRFIEERQPLVTLHGHVHEAARLTGAWSDRIGRTTMLSAAHDEAGELCLVRFDAATPAAATREIVSFASSA